MKHSTLLLMMLDMEKQSCKSLLSMNNTSVWILQEDIEILWKLWKLRVEQLHMCVRNGLVED